MPLIARHAALPARKADSLEHILHTGLPDEAELIQIYDNLSWELMIDDFDRASSYARKGIALTEGSEKWYEAAQLYCTLGIAYFYASRLDSAIAIYQTAIQAAGRIPVKIKDNRREKMLAKIYGNIGNIYGVQSKDNQALTYYLKAKELFEKWNNEINLAILYGNLGQIYLNLENFEQALVNFKKAENMLVAMNDSIQLTYVLDGLCMVYCHQLDFEKALECAEAQFRIHATHPDGTMHGRMLAQLSLANVWATCNDFEKAKEYATIALKDAKTLGNEFYRATALARLAKFHLYSGQYRESRHHAELSLQADTVDTYRVSRLYNVLATTEFVFGNYKKARDFHSKSEDLLQKRINKQYHELLLDMEMKYETEKKEIQIEALSGERKLFLSLAIVGGACVLLLITFMLLINRYQWLKKLRMREQLEKLEQEKQLIAAESLLNGENDERGRLSRELHDGLGGLLTMVRLDLTQMKKNIAQETQKLDNAIVLMDKSITEMRRLAHNLMPESLARFGLKPVLEEYCKGSERVHFHFYGESLRLNEKVEINFYRIACELINNALKHSGADEINVQLILSVDKLSLTISDNGKGLGDSEAKEGLTTVRSRIELLGASINIYSQPGKGTEITVELNLKPADQ